MIKIVELIQTHYFYASKPKEFYYLLLLTIGLSYLFIKWLTAALFKET